MLLRYIVSNFKSIGSPVEFTMLPSDQQINTDALKKLKIQDTEWQILRRGALFGHNASGKTSLIKSVEFAKKYVVYGRKSGTGTGVDQFRGNLSELKGISTFQFTFSIEQKIYEYGFAINNIQVCEEWLMVYDGQTPIPLFSRTTSEEGKTEIEIMSEFAKEGTKERELIEILKESLQEKQRNQLFLCKLSENGIKKAETIVDWFKHILIIFPNTKIRALPVQIKRDENLRDYLGKMLNKMDTGVYNIKVENKVIDFQEFAEEKNLPAEMINEIEEINNGFININGKYFIFSEEQGKKTLVQLKFEHHLNDNKVNFDIDDESDGTQRLLDLLPIIFSIGKNDTVCFIDELDRSIHTKLSHFFLNEFSRMSKMYDSNNQIIFTAHDVNLINLKSFIQDEIWFIEKDSKGESRLRPLSDFNVKEDQDILKAYLNGRFGAIPMIGGVD